MNDEEFTLAKTSLLAIQMMVLDFITQAVIKKTDQTTSHILVDLLEDCQNRFKNEEHYPSLTIENLNNVFTTLKQDLTKIIKFLSKKEDNSLLVVLKKDLSEILARLVTPLNSIVTAFSSKTVLSEDQIVKLKDIAISCFLSEVFIYTGSNPSNAEDRYILNRIDTHTHLDQNNTDVSSTFHELKMIISSSACSEKIREILQKYSLIFQNIQNLSTTISRTLHESHNSCSPSEPPAENANEKASLVKQRARFFQETPPSPAKGKEPLALPKTCP